MISEVLPLRQDKRATYGVAIPTRLSSTPRMGVDMMDCVLPPAPPASLLFTSEGRLNIKGNVTPRPRPTDPAAIAWSAALLRAYLRH